MGDEADYLSEWEDDFSHEDGFAAPPRRYESRESGGDRPQPKRWRCLALCCNPVLNEETAKAHKAETGHRVAKWPVRSAAGKAKARERNQTGYYDVYNVGYKDAEVRGIR